MIFIINAVAIRSIDKKIPAPGDTEIIPIALVDKSLHEKYPTKNVIHIYKTLIPPAIIAKTALFIKLKTAAAITKTNIPATQGDAS